MKSLKEQREKLLQVKLEEMADIGVKKRTEKDTPGFDDPIDLDDGSDFVEEDANVSLSKVDEQEEIPEETALNGTNAKIAQLSKRKGNDRTKDSPPATDFPECERRSLMGVRNGCNKSGFSIHTEVLQILRDMSNDIRSKAPVARYIEDILLDHLKTYQDLLDHVASRRRYDKTIDL